MRKVLIIAYYWPPSGGGGVQRWLKFTRYLPEFGWQPVVYVPYNPQYPLTDPSLMEKVAPHVQIIRGHIWEARRIYRRLKKIRHGKNWSAAPEMDTLFFREAHQLSWFGRLSLFLRSNLFVPDSRSLWIKPSVKRLKKWVRENPVEAIVSTGPPHSCHLIGMGLAKATGIPWIADFRDPWTDIDYFPRLLLTDRTRSKHERLQHAVLTQASMVVTVSPSWAKLFSGYGAKEIEVITNGFDEEDIPASKGPKKNTGMIQLASVGTIEADRNPIALWKALEILVKEDPHLSEKLRIHFAGKIDREIIPTDPKIQSILEFHGYVPHSEALNMMSQADVFLLIMNNNSDNNNAGRIPGKVFEYLACGKPILMLGRKDTDAGNLVSAIPMNQSLDHNDTAGLLLALRTYLSGNIPDAHFSDIEQYSRKSLTRRFARILDHTTSDSTHSTQEIL